MREVACSQWEVVDYCMQWVCCCVISKVSSTYSRYRLSSTDCVLSRTRPKYGELGFFCFSPAAWKSLASDLHAVTETNAFKSSSLAYFLVMFIHDLYGALGRCIERCYTDVTVNWNCVVLCTGCVPDAYREWWFVTMRSAGTPASVLWTTV